MGVKGFSSIYLTSAFVAALWTIFRHVFHVTVTTVSFTLPARAVTVLILAI